MSKISVITINYNNAEGLKKTIASVLMQTFQDFEFIVIDGKSTDQSVDVIKQNQRINYWESEKDNGIYHAQNKGAKKATGEYCLFLNSGDYLADATTLEKVAKELTKDIIYGDLLIEDAKGNRKNGVSSDRLDNYHFMISTLWHPCTFIKRSLFEQYGYYNESFKITGDYEFFIRTILKNGASYRHIPLPITIFDTSGVSNNPDNKKLEHEERRRSWLLNYSSVRLKLFEFKTKLKRRLNH